jgi:ElaB/YqjD/DUF883 family membrane-anchored ribosome-binding protein
MNNSGSDQRDQKFQGGNPDKQNDLNSTKNVPTSTSSSTGSTSGAATSRAMSSSGTTGSTIDMNSKGIVAQVKETAGSAYQTAAEKATGVLDEKRSTLSSGLTSVADSVRKLGENVTGSTGQPEGVAKFTADYSSTAAQKIEQVANYFETKDIKAMYRDADAFARQNPLAVIGGAFVVGLLAARFLKSSSHGNFSSNSSSTPLKRSNVRELGSFGGSDLGTTKRTSGTTGKTGSDFSSDPGRSI